MKQYGIMQTSELLELKPYIIRYWENHVPFLLGKKDKYGKKMYTNNEIYVLYRLKNLIRKQKFTLREAVGSLLKELASERGSHMRVTFLLLLNKIDHQKVSLQRVKEKINEIKGMVHG